jgi:CubicO group peptidase (beta-lactamase class C family)
MNQRIKYGLLGLFFWFLMFLIWEWWHSYPRVRIIPPSFSDSPEKKIDSVLIQSLNKFLIPGLAVGIIEEEKITYLKAFGFENLETKDSLTIKSKIPIASVSKIFTALSLANFALEIGISIDTSVNSILEKGKRLGPEFSTISIKDLLQHTSGLTENRRLSRFLPGGRNRPLSLLPESLGPPTLENRSFNYADINYDLIGYLLESASGMPYESFSKERILAQGGMESSSFFTQWPEENSKLKGYHQTFLWKRMEPGKLVFEHLPSASSGLQVTPEDLAKALLHLSRGEMGTFADELNWLKNGSEIPTGFEKITINQSNFIGHLGEHGGFSSFLVYSPALDIAFFMVSNGRDQSDFRKRISSEILKILNP